MVQLAVELLEQSYLLKAKNLDAENPLLETAHRELVLTINSSAMKALSEDKFDNCLELLRKSERYTDPDRHPTLRVLTYNNFGCYYRRLGKLKAAYRQLKEAVQLGARTKSGEHLAVTHLNMCAILSQKGQHEKALENAQVAVYHAQEELVSAKLKNQDSGASEEQMLTLAMAYHNMAVELEFVGKYQLCLQWYKKAMLLVAEHKETQPHMHANFRSSYVEVRKKIQGGVLVEKPGLATQPKSKKKHISHYLAAQRNHFSRRDEYEAELFKKLHSNSGVVYSKYVASKDMRPDWNTDVRVFEDADDPRYLPVARAEKESEPRRAHGRGGHMNGLHGLDTQSEHIPRARQRHTESHRQRPTSAHATLGKQQGGNRPESQRRQRSAKQQASEENRRYPHRRQRPTSAQPSLRSQGNTMPPRRQRPKSAHQVRRVERKSGIGGDGDGGQPAAELDEKQKLQYLEQLERANREAQEALDFLVRAGVSGVDGIAIGGGGRAVGAAGGGAELRVGLEEPGLVAAA